MNSRLCSLELTNLKNLIVEKYIKIRKPILKVTIRSKTFNKQRNITLKGKKKKKKKKKKTKLKIKKQKKKKKKKKKKTLKKKKKK